MLTPGHPNRFKVAAASVLMLALLTAGFALTLVNANSLRTAGWKVVAREDRNYRFGCQYYVQLRGDGVPEWVAESVHWSVQDRIRTKDQNRLLVTLYVSGQRSSLFVMGVVSTYDTLDSLAHCTP